MTTRFILRHCRWVLSLFVLSSAVLFHGAETTPAAPPPNVLLIISDDQAWGDYGFMGHPHIRTPHLDQLANESMLFTRAYVTAPLCRPSLASMVTGLYPHQHGITGNDPNLPDGANAMSSRKNPLYASYYEAVMERIEAHPTLPRLLATRGYRSLQTGKWWEGEPKRGGFTQGMTHGDPRRGGRHGDVGLTIGRETMEPIYRFVRETQRERRPFFIWYGVFLPHTPHNPPERLLEKYLPVAPSEAVARYWANCEWFDETCGELLGFLDQQGLRDNTLVVYVCDNGWIQDPGRSNRFAPRSKQSPFEGGIRTPIMLRWPGRIPSGRDEVSLVSSIDLAPTLLRACGLEPIPSMPGVDLRDDRALADRGQRVFAEAYDHNLNAFSPQDTLKYRVLIDGWWKLIQPVAGRPSLFPTLLFDLKSDPGEHTDLSHSYPHRVRRLQSQLDAWWDPSPPSARR